jgi:CheY-like chemotaxis protein
MTSREHWDRQDDPSKFEKPRTVLLVDDDAVTRMLVAHKITTMGAEVIEADDGIQALHYLDESHADLVVLDLEMPNMDGWDVISCIRGNPKTSHLPIIVLTGNESPEALEKSLKKGATSFLLKPLDWTAFGAHISHLLRLPSKAVPNRTRQAAA